MQSPARGPAHARTERPVFCVSASPTPKTATTLRCTRSIGISSSRSSTRMGSPWSTRRRPRAARAATSTSSFTLSPSPALEAHPRAVALPAAMPRPANPQTPGPQSPMHREADRQAAAPPAVEDKAASRMGIPPAAITLRDSRRQKPRSIRSGASCSAKRTTSDKAQPTA